MHTSFLLFRFWDLKLVSIDSASNSVVCNQLIFLKNGTIPRKAAKHENPVEFSLKYPLLPIFLKLENVGIKQCFSLLEYYFW